MKKIILLIIPLLLVIVTVPFRYESFILDFQITPTIFFLVNVILYYFFKKIGSKKIFLFTILGFIFSILFMIFIDGKLAIDFIPNVIMYLISIILAYLFNGFKLVWQKISIILIIFFLQFIYCIKLHEYVDNYANTGTFTGEINEKLNFDVKVKNYSGDTVLFNQNKYYILDFWFAGCGACLREFPQFEEFYLLNKSNSKLEFASINILLSNNDSLENMFLKEMRKKKYTFPVYTSVNKLDSVFKISSFPTIIIYNKDSIFFKGSLDLSKKYLFEHNIISSL